MKLTSEAAAPRLGDTRRWQAGLCRRHLVPEIFSGRRLAQSRKRPSDRAASMLEPHLPDWTLGAASQPRWFCFSSGPFESVPLKKLRPEGLRYRLSGNLTDETGYLVRLRGHFTGLEGVGDQHCDHLVEVERKKPFFLLNGVPVDLVGKTTPAS